jgi:predicted membrane protein
LKEIRLKSQFGVVYECFLPFLNTPDIWDAVFGVTGTAVAYIYLVMLKRNGLVAK